MSDERISWENLPSWRECVFEFHRHSNDWWIDDTRLRWTAVPTYRSALVCFPNQQSHLIDRIGARLEGKCRMKKEVIAMVELSLKRLNAIYMFGQFSVENIKWSEGAYIVSESAAIDFPQISSSEQNLLGTRLIFFIDINNTIWNVNVFQCIV